jgi:hypothetical protein
MSPLTDIRTWKCGIVPVHPVFPVITFLPVNDTPYKYFSSGVITHARTIDVEIYTKGFSKDAVEKNNLQILDCLEKQYRTGTNWTIGGYTFDTLFVNPTRLVKRVGDARDTSYIMASIVRLKCLTKNEKPVIYDPKGLSPTTDGTTFTGGACEELRLRLYTLFNNWRVADNTLELSLPEVRKIEKSDEPINAFPAIVIEVNNEQINRVHSGRDTIERQIFIHIYTRALPQEEHLYTNLELSTKILKILWIYPKLSLASNSNLNYDAVTLGEVGQLEYRERITDTIINDVKYNITPDFSKYKTTIVLTVKSTRRAINK